MMTREDIKAAAKEGMEEYIKESGLFIPPDRHFREHEFLSALMRWTDEMKGSILQNVIAWVVKGIFIALIMGAVVFFAFGGRPR